MRRSIPTLVLIAAMATATFLWVPAEAHAQHSRHRYGHGYQQGYGHGYGHRYGHGYRHGYGHGYGHGYRTYGSYGSEPYRCDCGSVRIELVPNELRQEAQVYVDGAHAGVVDDFDGIFQRLSLRPGQYEIEITHPGSKTFRKRILVSRGRTYALQHQLEPAMAQVQRDTRPVDSAPVETQSPNRGEEAAGLSYGSLRLQVAPRPAQAQVFVDGAHAGVVDDFDGTFQRLTLPTGSHEIEITLDGHRTFRRQVLVSRGRTYRVRHRIEPDARASAPAHEAAE